MKIFDCTTFYSEHMMMEVRFNILNEYVDKFIVVESRFSHSGEKTKLNFDINNYTKFKDKIIYLIIENEPEDIIEISSFNDPIALKRMNSIKRIEQSYNYMMKGIKDANDEDLIILSDNDEIPNLNSEQFKKSKKNIIIFKQLMCYYKFNLLHDRLTWYGSRACKFKHLKTFSWLKNIKNKKYSHWRIDTYFSKLKQRNLEIINDGGWHFTNVKSPKDLFIKMSNFGHHNEFELSDTSIEDLAFQIKNKIINYNHFTDKTSENKYDYNYKLKNLNPILLPEYLRLNKKKYHEWFEQS